jgi:hypothetical protein
MSANPGLKISGNLRSVLVSLFISPMLLAAATAQTQQPIFPTTQFVAQTGDALGMTTGDFNGDGLPDVAYLAVPYAGSPVPTVTVLLGQGANIPPVAVTTNPLNGCTGYSRSLAAADMNKDNKLDLVLTCSTGYVAVLIGNGAAFRARLIMLCQGR